MLDRCWQASSPLRRGLNHAGLSPFHDR
uniref:Uncharacterized protein n=1 Tax=Anguilla anguilla TaxID=7936 RepID=A0A0E9W0K0_ANGAN